MSIQVPTIEPPSLRAGDTLTWKRSFSDYPAPTWALSYTLINNTAKISISSSADGSDHLVDVSPATSAAYTAGWYDWSASVTDGSDVVTVGYGRIQVLPNLAAATTLDNRSHARKMLDAIESILEGRATASDIDVVSRAVGDRNFSRDPGRLLSMRDRYRADVAAEERAERIRNGLQSGRRIQTRLA